MTARRLLLAFIGGFLLMLVVLTPLSAALVWMAPDANITATRVQGNLWSGRLTGAAIGGLPLGTVKTRLEVLPLLTGAMRLEADSRNGAFTGKGRLISAGRRRGADKVDGVIALSQLGMPAAIDGSVKLIDVSAIFDRERCIKAGGKATAQAGDSGLISQPVTLTGAAACIDGEWVLPLAGEAGGLRVEAQLALAGDGGWRSELILIPTDPALGQGLAAAGFTQDGDRWRRVAEGRR